MGKEFIELRTIIKELQQLSPVKDHEKIKETLLSIENEPELIFSQKVAIAEMYNALSMAEKARAIIDREIERGNYDDRIIRYKLQSLENSGASKEELTAFLEDMLQKIDDSVTYEYDEEPHLVKARILRQLERYEEAAGLCYKIIKHWDFDNDQMSDYYKFEYYVELARSSMLGEDTYDYIDFLEMAIDVNQKSWAAYQLLMECRKRHLLNNTCDFEDSEEVLEEIFEVFDRYRENNPDAPFAKDLRKEDFYLNIIEALKENIQDKMRLFDFFTIAKCYKEIGQLDTGLDELAGVVEILPKKAEDEVTINQIDEFTEDLEKIRDWFEDETSYQKYADNLLDRFYNCLVTLISAKLEESEEGYLYNTRGTLYKYLGNSEMTDHDFYKAGMLGNASLAVYNKGLYFLKKGDYNEGIRIYNRCKILDPYMTDTYINLAYLYDKIDDYDRAVETYTELIKIEGTHLQAYLYRGYTYEKLDKTREACDDFTKVIELYEKGEIFQNDDEDEDYATDYLRAYEHRADKYYIMGDHEKSLGDYEKVLELTPDDPWAYINTAELMIVNKRLDDAGRMLEKLLAKNGEIEISDLQKAVALFIQCVALKVSSKEEEFQKLYEEYKHITDKPIKNTIFGFGNIYKYIEMSADDVKTFKKMESMIKS